MHLGLQVCDLSAQGSYFRVFGVVEIWDGGILGHGLSVSRRVSVVWGSLVATAVSCAYCLVLAGVESLGGKDCLRCLAWGVGEWSSILIKEIMFRLLDLGQLDAKAVAVGKLGGRWSEVI